MVLAHARGTNATERQIVLAYVKNRIVDTYAARHNPLDERLNLLCIATKRVKGQRMWASIDSGNNFVDLSIGLNEIGRAHV